MILHRTCNFFPWGQAPNLFKTLIAFLGSKFCLTENAKTGKGKNPKSPRGGKRKNNWKKYTALDVFREN